LAAPACGIAAGADDRRDNVESARANIRVPRPFFIAAQAIIGCMIARTLTPLFLAS
jgi:hypothetical protein